MSALLEIAKHLRAARVGLHADNLAASYGSSANVILIDDTGEHIADYFVSAEDDALSEIAQRIARKLLDGRNKRRIASVVVIPKDRRVSRIVDVEYPLSVAFSTEFAKS